MDTLTLAIYRPFPDTLLRSPFASRSPLAEAIRNAHIVDGDAVQGTQKIQAVVKKTFHFTLCLLALPIFCAQALVRGDRFVILQGILSFDSMAMVKVYFCACRFFCSSNKALSTENLYWAIRAKRADASAYFIKKGVPLYDPTGQSYFPPLRAAIEINDLSAVCELDGGGSQQGWKTPPMT